MMRNIKFRAWDRFAKEMVFAKTIDFGTNGAECIVDSDGINGDVGGEWDLEQYTGLHDKNGKEIYEGDIVEIIVEHNVYYPSNDAPKFTPIKKVCPVKVRPGIMTVGKWILCEFKQDKIQVIGNVHENPELLEKNK
ncbi:hypothetical protein R54839_PPFHFPJH_00155 [Fructobacillus fructosus]|uniref:YopX protein domain-containing protein n=2 Tax=Fructobacillus fructosus TaxID=1631 RepID=A0ABM9MLQ5_9LACO|nr:hypothetical protein R54839_PPFHFPJH_00155 [Fructobacillus fructosus]